LQEDAASGGCTVLILVAPDVDGIASCRLFTYLLRVDNIQYTIKTVGPRGWRHSPTPALKCTPLIARFETTKTFVERVPSSTAAKFARWYVPKSPTRSARGCFFSSHVWPRCQVMLNCGAIVDVREELELSVEESIRCFVLDSHRPVHLANIVHANEKVVVFDDGILADEDIPDIPVRPA